LGAALLALAALPLGAEFSPLEIEDAAEFARRAAMAAIRGPQQVFTEALDADSILARRVGPHVWDRLTARQKDRLRAAVREYFSLALGAPRATSTEVAWAWTTLEPNAVDVLLGLKVADKTLKTRWIVRRVASGWKVSDVQFVDPGISLASGAARALGPSPVRWRDRTEQAAAVATPRLVAILVIAAVVLIAYRRVAPEKRLLLLLAASAPAILFLVDGALAAGRAAAEPFVIEEVIPAEPWRLAEQMAVEAQQNGRLAAARDQWEGAVAVGAPASPAAYQMGLLARQQGNADQARADFLRALSGAEPAPGAARELALLSLAQGDNAAARLYLKQYLEAGGPDPETLSLAAVVATNLGDTAAALAAVRSAQLLVGEQWKSTEVEARVRARAADAAGAVQSLRPLARRGLVDRAVLRADPAYLPIATDPAWIAFLNERPALSPTPGPARP
jgi:tetratricopeptide (TPR) repeat protein